MFDRLFSAALTFCVLAGGTLAIGSEMLAARPAVVAARAPQTITLPRIVITDQQPAQAKLAQAESAAAARVQ